MIMNARNRDSCQQLIKNSTFKFPTYFFPFYYT